MDAYAVVQLPLPGLVVNMVVWDGGPDWSPPPDTEAVDIAGITPAPGIGWTYDGAHFTPPPVEQVSS